MKIKTHNSIFRNLFRIMSFLLILSNPSDVSAELNVNIKTPELGAGMAQLEALLDENVFLAAQEVESLATQMLEKPGLTRAFGSAVSLTGTIPLMGAIPLASRFSFSMGGFSSLYSYTMDAEVLTDQFSSLDPEDDLEIGAGARVVNAGVTFPLNRILPDLSFFASASYADLEGEFYSLNDFFIQGALGYPLLPEVNRKNAFSWSPLYLQAGMAYAYQSLGVQIPVGEIYQTFEMDPDGSGPLLGQDVAVLVDPVIALGLKSKIGSFSLAASTGIRFLDTLHFYLGTGCTISSGRTDIVLDMEEELIVQGYLSDLVEEPGFLSVDGAVEGSSPRLFMGYLFTGVQLEISSLFISIPLLYHPAAGLSAGFSLGVSL